jgi:hypothetical protein
MIAAFKKTGTDMDANILDARHTKASATAQYNHMGKRKVFDFDSLKANSTLLFPQLKMKRRGRPKGTKRYKSSLEMNKKKKTTSAK